MLAVRIIFSSVTSLRRKNIFENSRRFLNQNTEIMRGLVLGVYCDKHKQFCLTPSARKFDAEVTGKVGHVLNKVSPGLKAGDVRVLYDICDKYDAVALVALKEKSNCKDEMECVYPDSENVRIAASSACRTLQDQGIAHIEVEGFEDPLAAAEGAFLGTWKFQEFKTKNKKKPPIIKPYDVTDLNKWESGCIRAEAQNIARRLTDLPANFLTPVKFALEAKEMLTPFGVDVRCYEKDWIAQKGMNAFLSVSKGSVEPPVFLEIHYKCGNVDKPVVLVGKGITFDSGGISLKSSASMDEMRGDMGGAACIVGCLLAASQLRFPVHVIALIPLCENMPSGSATHPGDVVTALNGKTIQIDNTDAEGRLILADALSYAASFNPVLTLDVATLTGSIGLALSDAATGVFTTCAPIWDLINECGAITGDRVWRFPLFEVYSRKMTDYPAVDVNNLGKGKEAGACKAAAFLKEFAPNGPWIHMDIAGVMGPKDSSSPYLCSGMTGRPTRTLIQFLSEIGGSDILQKLPQKS